MVDKEKLNGVYEKLFDEDKRNFFTHTQFLRDSGFKLLDKTSLNMTLGYFKGKKRFNGVDLIINYYDTDEEVSVLYGLKTDSPDLLDFITESRLFKVTNYGDDDSFEDYDNLMNQTMGFLNESCILTNTHKLIVENDFLSEVILKNVEKELVPILNIVDYELIDECSFINLPNFGDFKPYEGRIDDDDDVGVLVNNGMFDDSDGGLTVEQFRHIFNDIGGNNPDHNIFDSHDFINRLLNNR